MILAIKIFVRSQDSITTSMYPYTCLQTTMNVTQSNLDNDITTQLNLPTFDDVALVKTLMYGTMFFISLLGNIATLIQMYRMRRRKSTINTLIVNLATADLIVTFFLMGTEAVWNTTLQWYAGEVMCKSVKFLQVFGLNLSTCITVVISLDRCFVIIDPMSRNKAPQRVKIMIAASWAWCSIFSIPQALVFTVRNAPGNVTFQQCIDHGYSSDWQKESYNVVTILFGFIIPLLIIGTAYGLISGTITRKSREFRDQDTSSSSSGSYRGQVRSHLFRKAKRKALRMSIVIVVAFVICWTPYYVLFACFVFLKLKEVNPKYLLGLLFIGLSNSLLNPIIYGAFQICKVHSSRSSKRNDWRSFSMRTPFSQPKCANFDVNKPLQMLGAKTGQFTLLQQRRGKVVVFCSCEKSEVTSPSLKPCEIFTYRLDQDGSLSKTAESSSRV